MIFPEGRGLLGGWNTLVGKLHGLGVVSLVRFLDLGGSTTLFGCQRHMRKWQNRG